jgi:hypothetical protein
MAKKDYLWRKYEQEIQTVLTAMDRNAHVEHNTRIIGRLSHASRQIDVLARGTVVRQEITVVAECKRYKRTVGIGTVDQFIGKLLDLGAERGILYSYSGFSKLAVQRAFGASNPSVIVVALESPEEVKAGPYGVDQLAVGLVDPLWADDLDTDDYLYFLRTGEWWK